MAFSDSLSIEQYDFDGMPAWQLIAPSGAQAIIAERGATLLSWEPVPGKNVIAGYQSAEELRNGVGYRSQIMAPWAGRISQSIYSFGGRDYDLSWMKNGATHGLVADKDFSVLSAGEALQMKHSFTGTTGYPWPFDLFVTYSLGAGADGEERLVLCMEAVNTNKHPIPLSLGWRPYLQFPGSSISNLSVSVPARTRILVDSDMIPLAGEAAYGGVKAPFEIDYLGSTVLDSSFRSLIPNADGVVNTVLTDPVTNARMEMVQEPAEAPLVHVYTADGLEHGERTAIALQPMSHVSDAFNRPDAAGSIGLGAGRSRSITATLTYDA
ncbi:MAG: aldose 1-epimerase [Actinomycetaceae bacterium]|nr:aldose 1-epimerase [Actinomycetaceae bacterium]